MKHRLTLFLTLFLMGALCSVYFIQSWVNSEIESLISEERVATKSVAVALTTTIATSLRHIQSLGREKAVVELLIAPTPDNRLRVTEGFSSLIQRNPDYDQVRWIDEFGQERVRVNNINGVPVIVPEQELQSKADRDYFIDTMALGVGDLYVSALDQNIEHGQVEMPPKYMLRIGKPIRDAEDHQRGILVINLLMTKSFDSAVDFATSSRSHIMLLSHQGTVLKGKGDGTDLIFSEQFPSIWKQMLQSGKESSISEDGVWVWGKIKITPESFAENVISKEPEWTVVSHIPGHDIQVIQGKIWGQFLPVFGFILIFSTVFSWFLDKFYFHKKYEPVPGTEDGLNSRWARIISSSNLALALAVVLPLLAVWVRLSLPASFGKQPLLQLFVLPICLCAALGGLWAGLVATATTLLFTTYFLIFPLNNLGVKEPYQLLNLSLLIGNGLFVSLISEALLRARNQAETRRREQALAMAMLSENEERHRLMTSCVRDYAITMLDPQGCFISWNEGARRLKGYEQHEILHRSFKLLYTPEDIAQGKPEQLLQTAIMEGQVEDTGLRVRKDGTTFNAEVIITSMRDAAGTLVGFTKITRDITERKEAEASIRQQAELLELCEDAILVWKWGGSLEYWNAGAQSLYGFTRSEAIGQVSHELLRTHFPESLAATTTALDHDGRWEGELTHITRDGQQVSVNARMVLFNRHSNPRVLEINRDIKWVKDISETKERLEVAASAGIVGIWDWHIPEDQLFWDPVMYKLYGLDEGDSNAAYTTWANAIHPDDKAYADMAVQAALRGEREYFNEFRVIWPDGSVHYLKAMGRVTHDAQGNPLRMIGVNYDVSEQKNIEKNLEQRVAERTAELQIANARLMDTQFAMDNVGIGIYWVDAASGQLLYTNDYAARMIDYPPGSLTGLYIWEIDPNYPENRYHQTVDLVRQHGQLKFETRQLAKSGRWVPVEVMVYVIEATENSSERLIAFLTDISDRKEAERELVLQKENAELSASAKSTFLANMSHEIRTPMNAVLGFCYLLEQKSLDSDSRDLVIKIHNSGNNLLNIINDILDFSKIESNNIDLENIPFNIRRLIDNIGSMMQSLAVNKDLRLVISPPAENFHLIGDEMRLQQVLTNLIGNAIKFTEAGRVNLSISCEHANEHNVELRFSVKDTGIGMTEDQLGKLFQAFSQADASINRRFGGTGLGLVISQRLIALMGGELQVNSCFGQGSEFWFVLPFQRENGANTRSENIESLNILIADDDGIARDGMLQTVKSLGWSGETVNSGEALIAQVLQRISDQKSYDVLLVDWKMPELDGLSAAKRLHGYLDRANSASPLLPIVLMVTSYAKEELAKQPGVELVNGVLTKPVTPTSLLAAVASVTHNRQLQQRADNVSLSTGNHLAGLRLLVVDDSDINQEVAKRILESEGASVTLANDGQYALDWLLAHEDAVDLVLMDIQMPRLDGYATTRALRQNPKFAELPILALTAGAFKSLQEAALNAGMNDFISKPFKVELMIEKIRHWTGGESQHDISSQAAPSTDQATDTTPKPTAITSLDNLPNLPGIDMVEGLKIWGSVEDFHRYLLRFIHQYQDAGHEIQRISEQGDTTAIKTLAHKMTGAAFSVALVSIAELCRQIEVCIEEPESVREAAEHLQAALDELQHSIDTWNSSSNKITPDGIETQSLQDSWPTVTPLLNQLIHALDKDDLDVAEAILGQLESLLDSQYLNPVKTALSEFDVREAERLAKALITTLTP